MGLFGLNLIGEGLRGGLDMATGGITRLVGEDTLAKVPIVGPMMGAQTDASKQLLATQQQLAEETRKQQQRNQQMRMNALGQQMLAFNPQNQAVAQMFGPEAAFSPQQMGQMVADPGARSQQEFSQAHAQAAPKYGDPIDPKTRSRPGQPLMGWSAEDLQRMEEDQRRQQMVAQNMTPLPPGPPPMQLPRPQAGRRY